MPWRNCSMATPLLECPSWWARTSLVANPSEGFVLKVESGGTPSTSNDDYWDGTIPWLTPRDVTALANSIYVSNTERSITPSGLRNSAASLLPANTVMLTKRAPVGAVAINAVPMATNQGFLNFRCGPRLRPLFLAYWLKINKRYLQQIANGSTYLELYKSDLFEFEVAVPPLDEQDAMLEAIGALQYVSLLGLPLEQSVNSPDELLRIQQQNRRLRRISHAMLVQLFSGSFNTRSIIAEVTDLGHV